MSFMQIKSINSEHVLNASGLIVTLIVGMLGAYSVEGLPGFPLVVALALLQLLCFSIFLYLEKPARLVLLSLFWIEAICIGSLFFLVPSSFIAILGMVWLIQAVYLFPGQVYLLWITCLSLYSVAQFYHYGNDRWIELSSGIVLYGMLQLFGISVVQRSVREREQQEETAALNRELIATRALLSQSAAQNERLRIARDLHDILGHYMTALILNLEVASHKTTGAGKDKVDQSLALAKLLLGELRSTVSELREDFHFNLEDSVRKLVAGIPLPVQVDFSRAPRIDDVEIAETLLRCTQEAITNVLRHSAASQCRVSLESSAGNYQLRISDDGTGTTAITAGNGLNGMRERVNKLGGELFWFRDDEGFHLQVALQAAGHRA